MDAAFMLNEEARTNFLQGLKQSFRCTYICLWFYLYPSNCLRFLAGYYQEEENHATSSAGSPARRLFDAYRRTPFYLDNNNGNSRVPGLAFRTSVPYLELTELQIRTLASSTEQQQFYQEARIKKAVFMGCRNGEIELGFANEIQANLEIEMRNWFPEDFLAQLPTVSELPQPTTDPNRFSSSSSSLRSPSMDSPEYTSLLFNIPSSTQLPPITIQDAPPILQRLQAPIPTPTTTISSHELAMQAFAQIRNVQLPTRESENAAMTEAFLRVFTSTTPPLSSSSSSMFSHHLQSQQNPGASAFRNYTSPTNTTPMSGGGGLSRPSMFKQAISYYRRWNITRRQQMLAAAAGRPSTTQLHHMISERRRREKLNESFQALRSLLPPGTKKDKASVLASTREFLSSLKAQVEELTRRNQVLESQRLMPAASEEEESTSSTERFSVRLAQVSESTSEERILDLQVVLRGDCPTLDMVIRILEFLKQDRNVNLMSMETNTRMIESSVSHRLILRLRVEGSEWDESAFQEAIRRVVADMTQ